MHMYSEINSKLTSTLNCIKNFLIIFEINIQRQLLCDTLQVFFIVSDFKYYENHIKSHLLQFCFRV